MASDPGQFGWVGKMFRWSGADASVGGQGGLLPPPKLRALDSTEHDIYQGLADGWMHGTVGAALSSFFSEPRTRKELYVLYEKMDMTDICSAYLDMISEDATQVDHETDRVLWTEGENDYILQANEELFQRLKTEEEATGIARDVAKFGDDFERLVYRSGIDGGIRRMIYNPPINITRKEDKEGKLEGYMQMGKKFRNDNSEISYPWDFAHFRLRGRDRRYPYGTSLLFNAIRPWKQLIVMEDWMLSYTVQRHPDRNLIMLDIGTSSEVEAAAVARTFKQKLRKHILVDPDGTSGRNLGQRLDPWSPLEDLVLPVRTDSRTDVKQLRGSANAADITPLLYVIDKMFLGLRTPKSFFGYEEGVLSPTDRKAALTNQDIRYARTARRLQNSVRVGHRYLCEMNLTLLSAPGSSVTDEKNMKAVADRLDWRKEGADFTVCMSKISFLEELERLEVQQTRQQVALAMMELSTNNPAVDLINYTTYIFREIMQIPDEKLNDLIRQDIEQEHVDNIQAGLLPDGTDPRSANTSEGKRRQSAYLHLMERLRKSPRLRKEADKANGDLTEADKKLVASAIRNSPRLRKLINLGHHLFNEDTNDVALGSTLLPNRDNDLFKKGMLKDSLTDKDVQEMVDEAVGAAS